MAAEGSFSSAGVAQFSGLSLPPLSQTAEAQPVRRSLPVPDCLRRLRLGIGAF